MALSPAQFLVDYSAGNVRVFFRVYFIVLGTTVGPLGQACSAAAAKLKLSKGKDVKLTEMLGWQGGWDTLMSLWRLRAFPSGPFLTLFMLVAYFVALASDLAGSYIRSVNVHDHCPFGTGLVLSPTRSMSEVPWNGYPYTFIQQALSFSLANDGLQGIYAKVNQDKSFSANDNDILGTWKCSQNSIELDYPTNETAISILADLLNHGLLYNVETAIPEASNANTSREHIAIVDTSNDGTIGVPWDVRACISTYNAESNTNTMLSFQCTLEDDVGWLKNVLKGINTVVTIPDWIQLIQGSCYSGTGTPARPDLGTILEKIFNTMVMIASGGNYLLDSSQSSSTQGCVTSRTWILWEVIALAVVAAALNVFLLAYLAVLKLLTLRSSRREHYATGTEAQATMKKELKSVPGDFLEWTSHAVEESRAGDRTRMQDGKRTKPRGLKSCRFGWRDQDHRFGILKDGEHNEEVGLLVVKPK